MNEDAIPANCAGSGEIKGIGTGSHPGSEPGVPKKNKLKFILARLKRSYTK